MSVLFGAWNRGKDVHKPVNLTNKEVRSAKIALVKNLTEDDIRDITCFALSYCETIRESYGGYTNYNLIGGAAILAYFLDTQKKVDFNAPYMPQTTDVDVELNIDTTDILNEKAILQKAERFLKENPMTSVDTHLSGAGFSPLKMAIAEVVDDNFKIQLQTTKESEVEHVMEILVATAKYLQIKRVPHKQVQPWGLLISVPIRDPVDEFFIQLSLAHTWCARTGGNPGYGTTQALVKAQRAAVLLACFQADVTNPLNTNPLAKRRVHGIPMCGYLYNVTNEDMYKTIYLFFDMTHSLCKGSGKTICDSAVRFATYVSRPKEGDVYYDERGNALSILRSDDRIHTRAISWNPTNGVVAVFDMVSDETYADVDPLFSELANFHTDPMGFLEVVDKAFKTWLAGFEDDA